MKHLLLLLPWLLTAVPALAQQAESAKPAGQAAPTTATAPADTAQTPEPKPDFFGYVGVYYGYDFNNPADLRRPGFIYSENLHNQIAINIALLGARYQSERVRGTFAIQTGTYPDANYAAEPQIFKHIYEAWGGVKLTKNVWLDAGIFLSHIGLEGPISRDDLTLTRSIMADNSPYYEAGAKLTYDAGRKWLVAALVLNGWQVIRDNNQNMSLGTQVQFRPSGKWLLNSSTYAGEGRNEPDSVGRRLRYFHDFFVTYDATPKWKLAAAFDIGVEERDQGRSGYHRWHGGALIARRRLGQKTAAVGRFEYYHDPNGVVATTPAGGLRTLGYSLGLDYAPVPRVTIRLEGKQFRAADRAFVEDHTLKRTNTTLTTLLGLTF